MGKTYLFTSERLGFRDWLNEDLEVFAALNADEDVMEHFPKPLTKEETAAFIKRLQKLYSDRGYTYFAVELLDTGELIGFIGLAYQDYEVECFPAVDIGWRLKKSAWGKGYATEGAQRCLAYAFNELKLDSVIAICPIRNSKSQQVMKKIGMTKMGVFKHPRLKEYPEQATCFWYEIKKD